MMQYAVVIEKTEKNYSAYVPDLPGCVATARTAKAALREIHKAIDFHLEGLREDELPIPEPTATCEYVQVRTDSAAAKPKAKRATAKR